MPVLFRNNAVSSLEMAINASQSTLAILLADAPEFPGPLVAGEWFPITVMNMTTTPPSVFEIMRCTDHVGGVMTVVRGQEGTTAKAFPAGARVSLHLTRAALETLLQDAPSDGNTYGRSNGQWAEITGGGGGGTSSGEWSFNGTTSEPPGGGQVRLNNSSQPAATKVWVSKTTATGIDAANTLRFHLKPGAQIYLQDKDDSAEWQLYNITGPAVDDGTYFDVPVLWKEGGMALPAGQRCVFAVIAASGAGVSIGDTPPATPVAGQLWWESDSGKTYIWYDDGSSAQWVQQSDGGGPIPDAPQDGKLYGRVDALWSPVVDVAISRIDEIYVTTSQTWTKQPGLKGMGVWLTAGGGGANAAAGTAAANSAASGGGGGGGTCYRYYDADELPASAAITIATGGGLGANGGSSTFLSMVANGGGAGAGSTPTGNTFANSGAGGGGGASGGSLNLPGTDGENGVRAAHGTVNVGMAGGGGNSFFGRGFPSFATVASLNATTGNFPGGGARGAANGASQAVTSAAGGGAGLGIFKEYY